MPCLAYIGLLAALVAVAPAIAGAQEAPVPLTSARADVLSAVAAASLPSGDTWVATPLMLGETTDAIDARLPHLGDDIEREVRLQLAAASLDIALLDQPQFVDEEEDRLLVRVGDHGHGHAHPEEASAVAVERRVVSVSASREDALAPPIVERRATREPPPERTLVSVPTQEDGERWMVPVEEPRITSRFGPRIDPITGELGRMHRGTDFGGPTGTPVMATASGTVVLGGWCDRGTGNCVVIDHAGGWRSQYFHLSSVDVRPGMQVAQGEVIGEIGSTGRSTGPHLHFQLGQGSTAVDAEPLFGELVE